MFCYLDKGCNSSHIFYTGLRVGEKKSFRRLSLVRSTRRLHSSLHASTSHEMTIMNVTRINLLELYYGEDNAFYAYSLYAVYVAISGWCIAANLFLLVVLLRHESLRTHANVFVANIAASDTCLGLSTMLVRPFDLLTHATVEVARMSCLAFVFSAIFTNMTSIHALLCATCERYVKICHPYRAHALCRGGVVGFMIGLSWSCSFIFTGLLLIGPHWYPASTCHFTSVVDIHILSALAFYPTLLIVFLCFFNARIFMTVRRHRRQIQVQVAGARKEPSSEGRTKIVGLVVMLTLVSYFVYFLSVLGGMLIPEYNTTYYVVSTVSFLIMFANNIANPVIFGWKDKLIRKHAKKLLGYKFVDENEPQNRV
jgi:hypothetical protein